MKSKGIMRTRADAADDGWPKGKEEMTTTPLEKRRPLTHAFDMESCYICADDMVSDDDVGFTMQAGGLRRGVCTNCYNGALEAKGRRLREGRSQ